MMKTSKKAYIPPLLEFYEYAVEHGFAGSKFSKTQAETFSEINEQTTRGTAGENYHDMWGDTWETD